MGMLPLCAFLQRASILHDQLWGRFQLGGAAAAQLRVLQLESAAASCQQLAVNLHLPRPSVEVRQAAEEALQQLRSDARSCLAVAAPSASQPGAQDQTEFLMLLLGVSEPLRLWSRFCWERWWLQLQVCLVEQSSLLGRSVPTHLSYELSCAHHILCSLSVQMAESLERSKTVLQQEASACTRDAAAVQAKIAALDLHLAQVQASVDRVETLRRSAPGAQQGVAADAVGRQQQMEEELRQLKEELQRAQGQVAHAQQAESATADAQQAAADVARLLEQTREEAAADKAQHECALRQLEHRASQLRVLQQEVERLKAALSAEQQATAAALRAKQDASAAALRATQQASATQVQLDDAYSVIGSLETKASDHDMLFKYMANMDEVSRCSAAAGPCGRFQLSGRCPVIKHFPSDFDCDCGLYVWFSAEVVSALKASSVSPGCPSLLTAHVQVMNRMRRQEGTVRDLLSEMEEPLLRALEEGTLVGAPRSAVLDALRCVQRLRFPSDQAPDATEGMLQEVGGLLPGMRCTNG